MHGEQRGGSSYGYYDLATATCRSTCSAGAICWPPSCGARISTLRPARRTPGGPRHPPEVLEAPPLAAGTPAAAPQPASRAELIRPGAGQSVFASFRIGSWRKPIGLAPPISSSRAKLEWAAAQSRRTSSQRGVQGLQVRRRAPAASTSAGSWRGGYSRAADLRPTDAPAVHLARPVAECRLANSLAKNRPSCSPCTGSSDASRSRSAARFAARSAPRRQHVDEPAALICHRIVPDLLLIAPRAPAAQHPAGSPASTCRPPASQALDGALRACPSALPHRIVAQLVLVAHILRPSASTNTRCRRPAAHPLGARSVPGITAVVNARGQSIHHPDSRDPSRPTAALRHPT